MEFFGLSPIELIVIVVVAILVFGQRLPQVAGETAATLQRVKRTLSDLRRETGIDQEIYRAKREFEEAQREARKADVRPELAREASSAAAGLNAAAAGVTAEPGAPAALPEAGVTPRPESPQDRSPESAPARPDRG